MMECFSFDWILCCLVLSKVLFFAVHECVAVSMRPLSGGEGALLSGLTVLFPRAVY